MMIHKKIKILNGGLEERNLFYVDGTAYEAGYHDKISRILVMAQEVKPQLILPEARQEAEQLEKILNNYNIRQEYETLSNARVCYQKRTKKKGICGFIQNIISLKRLF